MKAREGGPLSVSLRPRRNGHRHSLRLPFQPESPSRPFIAVHPASCPASARPRDNPNERGHVRPPSYNRGWALAPAELARGMQISERQLEYFA